MSLLNSYEEWGKCEVYSYICNAIVPSFIIVSVITLYFSDTHESNESCHRWRVLAVFRHKWISMRGTRNRMKLEIGSFGIIFQPRKDGFFYHRDAAAVDSHCGSRAAMLVPLSISVSSRLLYEKIGSTRLIAVNSNRTRDKYFLSRAHSPRLCYTVFKFENVDFIPRNDCYKSFLRVESR